MLYFKKGTTIVPFFVLLCNKQFVLFQRCRREFLLYTCIFGDFVICALHSSDIFEIFRHTVDFDGFGEFFSELHSAGNGENVSFEILTYHEFGKEKYIKAGMEYTVTDGFVTDNDIKKLASEITNADLTLINT